MLQSQAIVCSRLVWNLLFRCIGGDITRISRASGPDLSGVAGENSRLVIREAELATSHF